MRAAQKSKEVSNKYIKYSEIKGRCTLKTEENTEESIVY